MSACSLKKSFLTFVAMLAALFILSPGTPVIGLNAHNNEVQIIDFQSINLSQRHLCDLELIMNGGFAPIDSFMDKATYLSVLDNMRLPDGTLWPIPIVLDVSDDTVSKLKIGQKIELVDPEGTILAYLHISEIWQPDKNLEAIKIYGTTDPLHPGVNYLFEKTNNYYISGKLTKVCTPKHYDFIQYRHQPNEIKAMMAEKKIDQMVGFQTRNPLHRAHIELTLRALSSVKGHLLLHPAVGMTKPGDIDHFTRVKCYEKILKYYPEGTVTLCLLPISMRMAGPREALWHAIIRKNYGCTHFIVGRDHAGPGKDSFGKDFYGPYEAQDLVKKYAKEIGIEILPYKEMVYVVNEDRYQPLNEISPETKIASLSGTELRNLLQSGREIPSWFSYPEVIEELRNVYPPKSKQGLTIFLTGLPASGKSTIANALAIKLMEIQKRPITILDGDIIRKNLSSELGFSKEHRSINVRRVGYVSSEITKNGGISICALIAPFDEDRLYNRALISNYGGYIEVYLSTPVNICEQRDPKKRYSLARLGILKGFTGIDDPYEIPSNSDLILDTSLMSIKESVNLIISHLSMQGFIDH